MIQKILPLIMGWEARQVTKKKKKAEEHVLDESPANESATQTGSQGNLSMVHFMVQTSEERAVVFDPNNKYNGAAQKPA